MRGATIFLSLAAELEEIPAAILAGRDAKLAKCATFVFPVSVLSPLYS